MTYSEAVKALLLEGASHSDPLYYAYCDGYHAARTMNTPTESCHYTGVATTIGYFKNSEVIYQYDRGLEAGLKNKV